MKLSSYRKKLGRIIFLSLLIALMLAGCGDGKADPSADEPGNANTDVSQTEFEVMGGMSALSPGYANNVVLNKLMEETGVKITWNTLSDSVAEQVNIRIAGGDLPDAFMGVGFSNFDLARYGRDGTFIDLTPYLTPETMPNLAKILDENPDIRAAITMNDGKIYGLPSAERMGTKGIGKEEDYSIFTIPQFSMINKAWLDDLNLEVPTTLDELHDVLIAFKENDMSAKYYGNEPGSTIPLSIGTDQWCWGQNIFYAGFGFTNWPNDVINDLILTPEGKVEFVSVSDNYRAALAYFHEWFKEGLFDVEMFSQDHTQLMAKTSQGYVGVSTWWYIEELMAEYSKDYVFLPVLDGPDGTHNVTVRTGGGTSSGQLSITNAAKSPANLLKFYDRWYEPEIVMQLQYGPIDVFFTGKDENGVWLSITEEESREKFGKSAGELKNEMEVSGPKLILSDYYKTTFKMEDRAIERLEDLYNFWMPYVDNPITYPIDVVFTEDELDTIDRFKTDFENTVAENEGLWLRDGAPTDDEWETYKIMLIDNCGMDKLLAVYQAAYDRYISVQNEAKAE